MTEFYAAMTAIGLYATVGVLTAVLAVVGMVRHPPEGMNRGEALSCWFVWALALLGVALWPLFAIVSGGDVWTDAFRSRPEPPPPPPFKGILGDLPGRRSVPSER